MNNFQPPKLPLRFFRWFCHPDYREDIEGDLLERFEKKIGEGGVARARWQFTLDVFRLLRPGIVRSLEGSQQLNYIGMLRHTFTLSIRNFKRYKNSFLINLTGLSTGLACTLLIYLWVNDELHVDKFHEKDTRLYEVMGHWKQGGNINTWNGTATVLAEALEQELPDIEAAVSATDPSWDINFLLETKDKKLNTTGKYVGGDYFRLFSYKLLHGKEASVLASKNAVVISRELAESLFSNTSQAIGKTIEWKETSAQGQAIVTGVFENIPANSTDQFDFVLPFDIYKQNAGEEWRNPNAVTYVLLKEGSDIASANEKLSGFMKSRVNELDITLFLKPYSEKYLYGRYENGMQTGGRIEYVHLFSLIAVFILVMACINFMNLSTARASRRIKEIGVKKAVGASRGALIAQYLGESILMAMMAVVVALVLVAIFVPQFNQLTRKHLVLQFELPLLAAVLSVAFFTGFVSGIYPALYLSALKPVEVLKGKIKNATSEQWIRKGLVLLQFAISTVLLVSVFVVFKQMQLVQNKNLGYEKDNVILLENSGKVSENIDVFLREVKNIPGVVNASATTTGILNPPTALNFFKWEGMEEGSRPFGKMIVYYDFIETLGIDLIKGRTFSRNFSDEAHKVVVNESAVKEMGFDDPVGKKVKFYNMEMEIIGVVKDFHFQSLHEKVGPLFFHMYPTTKYINQLIVKLKAGAETETISRLEAFYSEFNHGNSLEFSFLDQQYQALYEGETKVADLSRYFAGFAILISCLGLFGLVAFTVERRTKEVGIRKILGASVFGIARMLTSDFTKLVLVAILVSSPVSYWITKSWLDGFAYRIELTWWFFAGAGLLALLIAWSVVAIQTLKAAKVNPAQCLRNE